MSPGRTPLDLQPYLKLYVGAIRQIGGRLRTSVQLDEWARAVVDASPPLDSEDRRIMIATYRLLARGEPVSEPQIAGQTGLATERVEASLRQWPLVLRDDRDRVIGFWGMHAHRVDPTHAMTHDENTVFGWCAIDTLFIPEIIDRDVQVESTDPTTGTTIRLTVTREGVVDLDPPEAVVSFLLPENGERFVEDAIARFCHQIYFFDSPRSAEEWIGSRPGRYFMPVEEAFELGKRINRLRLGTIDKIKK
jgi:alkylmercury lyase